MSDCVPSPSSDSSYGPSSGSNSSSDSSSSPSCEISLLERLIRTHPIWFLPSLQRSAALHLLQGRATGNFIVRSSTQPMTMALSVKLPGYHVEHYLLKAVDNRITLENSTHTFETVHQLIAHYCTLSEEIPVCLRVPAAIAEATTRQQLRSLALLGQEFWTHSTNGNKDIRSPTEGEVSKNFNSSGQGSQSSCSSQSSLCDLRSKPNRPTTLELSALSGGSGGTPPPVPPRWSRSNFLTPISLPSSIQSTPSEAQSTFSENGREVKKRKRRSGGKESIHYKESEILALFKGTKTNYDDKASDYEDIWSPQYSGKSPPPPGALRLSTFKPDLIVSSLGSQDSLYSSQPQKPPYQILHPNQNNNNGDPTTSTPVAMTTTQFNNNKNNRLSFNGGGSLHQIGPSIAAMTTHAPHKMVGKAASVNLEGQGTTNSEPTKPTKSTLYSEPVDSIVTFRRFGHHRHSEPNIRWSQPASMSLVHLDPDFPENLLSRLALAAESPTKDGTTTIDDLNLAKVSRSRISPRNQQATMTCASVDNLCHLREIKRKAAKKFSCGVVQDRTDDEEEEEGGEFEGQQGIVIPPTKPPLVKPQPLPRKKPAQIIIQKEHQEEHEILETSNNRSWHVDNSWEFVMLESQREETVKTTTIEGSSRKFPVPPPKLVSPNNNNNGNMGINNSRQNLSHYLHSKNNPLKNSEEILNDFKTNGKDAHRFSRYDNLEGREDDEEDGSADEDSCDPENRNEKISTPWDSSKWEHLLRLVSESTQQLDSLEMSEDGSSGRHNKNLFRQGSGESKERRESRILAESKQRISKILEVSGNLDKASRAISSVVRTLAEKDNGFFGPTLKSFIACTITAKIQDPYKVMRNIRQFISGMKNYLVGVSLESAELRIEIKKQTESLTDCEFLNIDAILEDILVDLVIAPLNSHIRGLIESHYSNSRLRLSQAPLSLTMLSKDVQEKLKKIMNGFEEINSPIKKLDKWNEFVCQVQELENYSSESFLPVLADCLSCVCAPNIQSDVDYMIGLLPSSLAETNNYSLSLLQSALASLRSKENRKESLTCVRVIVPDERNGTLIRKMVPIRETTTTKEVAKMVASKVGIANLADYVLVRIKNGEEKLCHDGQLVSQFLEDNQTALAYKRIDAKIGWPQRIS